MLKFTNGAMLALAFVQVSGHLGYSGGRGLNVAVMRDQPRLRPLTRLTWDLATPRFTPSTPPPTVLLEMYYPAPLVVSVMNAAHISGPQSAFLLFSTLNHAPSAPTTFSPCVPPDLQQRGGGGDAKPAQNMHLEVSSEE